jgi:hypothetical protein
MGDFLNSATAGGIVSGVGSVFTNMQNKRYQKQLMKLQYQYNQQASDAQQKRDLATFDYENGVGRRIASEKSGMLDSGAVAGAGTSGSGFMPSSSGANLGSPVSSAMNGAMQMAQLRKTDAETDNIEANTDKQSSETTLNELQAPILKATAEFQRLGIEGKKMENALLAMNKDLFEATKDIQVANMSQSLENAKATFKSIMEGIEHSKRDRQLMDTMTRMYEANTAVAGALKALHESGVRLNEAQTSLMWKRGFQQDMETLTTAYGLYGDDVMDSTMYRNSAERLGASRSSLDGLGFSTKGNKNFWGAEGSRTTIQNNRKSPIQIESALRNVILQMYGPNMLEQIKRTAAQTALTEKEISTYETKIMIQALSASASMMNSIK